MFEERQFVSFIALLAAKFKFKFFSQAALFIFTFGAKFGYFSWNFFPSKQFYPTIKINIYHGVFLILLIATNTDWFKCYKWVFKKSNYRFVSCVYGGVKSNFGELLEGWSLFENNLEIGIYLRSNTMTNRGKWLDSSNNQVDTLIISFCFAIAQLLSCFDWT